MSIGFDGREGADSLHDPDPHSAAPRGPGAATGVWRSAHRAAAGQIHVQRFHSNCPST